MQYIRGMKTSTIPSVRVAPELRDQVESVLAEGESLSQFVEASVRESVARRLDQAEFVKRGLASLDAAKRGNQYVTADEVIQQLQEKLSKARAIQAGKVRGANHKK